MTHTESELIALKEKMKARDRALDNNTWLSTKYWKTKLSITEEEAKIIVSDLQRANGNKRKGYFKHQHPSNIEYYMKDGYSVDDSTSMVLEYNKSLYISNVDKLNGEEYAKFKLRYGTRTKNMIEKYGTSVVSSNVSKESLRFFIKLYKKLRRFGFARADFMWGIRGSREFGTHYEGKNYLYDFCILSKRIIVEYNGTFWHPRPDLTWTNPFGSLESAIEHDALKKDIITNLGFKLRVVWSDDDLCVKIDELFEEIIL
jgi:very-short-patch-repair endonuclease